MSNQLEGKVTTLEGLVRRLDERLDSIENLMGTAARFAERALERVDSVERGITHIQQDLQFTQSLSQRNAERLDRLEAGQRSIVAGQQCLEVMTTRVLERLKGKADSQRIL